MVIFPHFYLLISNSYLPFFSFSFGDGGGGETATSFKADKCLRPREYMSAHATDRPIAFVVGAIAQGELKVDYVDDSIAISNYAMSAAGVCAKLTDAAEEVWGVL